MSSSRCRRGFSVADLVVICVAVVILVAITLPLLQPRRHHGYRQLKDSSQVRGIMQALVVWTQNDQGRFPLPSRMDLSNATVTDSGAAKDTTANILSILVQNAYAPVEILVSPAESNLNIKRMENYEFENPKAAADPAHALWDPALSADFTSPQGGHTSYAHVMPTPVRWDHTAADLSGSSTPVIGSRGPEVKSVSRSGGRVAVNFARPDSNTLIMHGSRTKWEGNIGYADNHVQFETRVDPESMAYRDAGGHEWPDVLFYDEPDDRSPLNAYLGIFIRAGERAADFKAIWD